MLALVPPLRVARRPRHPQLVASGGIGAVVTTRIASSGSDAAAWTWSTRAGIGAAVFTRAASGDIAAPPVRSAHWSTMDRFEAMEEAELVEAARTDANAFAELYRRYVDRIHGFALRRTGSRAVAEDVTSATFARALEKLHRYRAHRDGFAPWIHRLAANEIAEHHRGRARHNTERAQAVLARHHSSAAPAADVGVGADADRAALRDAVSRLSTRHQQVLSLRFFADLTAEEAATAMGMSTRTFAVAMHRAKGALRKELEREEGAG